MHERVVDEDPADLKSSLLVAERRRLGAVLDRQLVPGGQRDSAKLVRQDLGERREIDVLLLDLQPAGVEPRKVEQVRGQLRQARNLLPHRRHELALRLRVEILVGHQLQETAEGEERRAELVRGVRDELAPSMLQLGQALAHPLERGCELPDLVLARVLHRLTEVAAGDPVGGPLEVPDPAGEHRCRQVSDQERGGQGNQAGNHEPPAHQMDALERVAQRRAEQDDGATVDRVGDLRITLTA